MLVKRRQIKSYSTTKLFISNSLARQVTKSSHDTDLTISKKKLLYAKVRSQRTILISNLDI